MSIKIVEAPSQSTLNNIRRAAELRKAAQRRAAADLKAAQRKADEQLLLMAETARAKAMGLEVWQYRQERDNKGFETSIEAIARFE